MKSIKKIINGVLVLGLLVVSSGFASAPSVFAQTGPAITVSAPNPQPFGQITVSGSGFAAGESVHVALGLASANTTASGSGGFSGVMLTIPNVPSGLYLVVATGQTSGLQTFAYVWVNALYPTAAPSSWFVAPGSSLTFSGSGFAPSEQVVVSATGSSSLATFTTNSSGSFSSAGATLVPYALHGSLAHFTLHGVTSGANVTLALGVGDLYPYTTPSTWYARAGTAISFSGSGFGHGETIQVYAGASTTPAATFAADASGSFANQSAGTLPFGSASPITYRLVGAQSGATATAPITLAPFGASITPSVWYSAPGGNVSLTGTGFAPNEQVAIAVGGHAQGTATADGSGALTFPAFALPAISNTTTQIVATGQMSHAVASISMTLGAYYPWLNLSTYWANGGSALTITGGGYAPGETVNFLNAGTMFGSAVANSSGNISGATTVPFAAPGAITINGVGATSGAATSINMTVAPVYTDLQLGSYAGAPGSAVQFIGHGYLPNEPVQVTTDRTGAAPVANFAADAGGSFSNSSYLLPAGFAQGNLTLTVKSLHSFNTKSIVYYVTGH